MSRTRSRGALALVVIALLVASCTRTDEPIGTTTSTTTTTEPPFTVLDLLADTGRHARFLELVDRLGLDETFREDGPYTLFAPTDEAFASLPAAVNAALEDPNQLREAILYHAVVGELRSEAITEPGFATTMTGFNIDLRPGAGGGIEINGVPVTVPDLVADNGVVHEIDAFLTRPTVGDILEQSDEFESFLIAVERAGLIDEFRDAGPITVLVPNDAAFDQADFDRLNALGNDLAALRRFVRFYIVDGTVRLTTLTAPTTVMTRAGVEIELTPAAGATFGTAAGALVVNPDVPALNGVLHVLDDVIFPPDLESPPDEGEGDN